MRPIYMIPLVVACVCFTLLSIEDSDGATPSTGKHSRVVVNTTDDAPDLVIAEPQYRDAADLLSWRMVIGAKTARFTYRVADIPADSQRVAYDIGLMVRKPGSASSGGSVLSYLSGEARMTMGDADIAWSCDGSSTVTDKAAGVVRQTVPLRCLPKRAEVMPVLRYYIYTPKLGYWSLVGSDSYQTWSPAYTFRGAQREAAVCVDRGVVNAFAMAYEDFDLVVDPANLDTFPTYTCGIEGLSLFKAKANTAREVQVLRAWAKHSGDDTFPVVFCASGSSAHLFDLAANYEGTVSEREWRHYAAWAEARGERKGCRAYR